MVVQNVNETDKHKELYEFLKFLLNKLYNQQSRKTRVFNLSFQEKNKIFLLASKALLKFIIFFKTFICVSEIKYLEH